MSVLLPRRRIGRVAIYFVCMVLVLVAGDLILVQLGDQIPPGYETTRITSPTLPDGSIDYLTAVDDAFGEGVTPENNAAVPLLHALGRSALPSNQPPDGITERLGMDHLPDQGDYFVAYSDYCKAHSITTDTDEAFDATKPLQWPPKLSSGVEQWLQANQRPLDLIVQATRRPRYFIPFNGGYRPDTMAELLIPQVGLLRQASRALLARSMIRLEAGDIAGFQRDVMAVHRLARLMDQAPTLIELLVAMEPCETGACHADRLAAASGKLSPQQERDWAGQLASLRDLNSCTSKIDRGERFMQLDIMQTLAVSDAAKRARILGLMFGGFIRSTGFSEPAARFWPIHFAEAMRELNRYCDGMIIAAEQPTYSGRMSAIGLWSVQVQELQRRNPILAGLSADWPVATLMPSLSRLETRSTTVKMEKRLTVIALMLAAFKTDHGVYPDSLNELGVDTDDLFSDRPLDYVSHKDAYELHSAGENLSLTGGVREDFEATFPQMKH